MVGALASGSVESVESLSYERGVVLERVRACGTDSGWNLVAFSGGVDSALVAWAVYQVFPRRSLAVIGVSASLPLLQLAQAQEVARYIGMPLREVRTGEGAIPEYVSNTGASCYHCKMTLYRTLHETAALLLDSMPPRSDTEADGERVLYNGTNAEDLLDSTRSGLVAASENCVCSPIDHLSKSSIRLLARDVGLPVWDYAASPCLRSRLQYGVPATSDNLKRIEEAEALLRAKAELLPQENARVRLLLDGRAAVELDALVLPRAKLLQSALEELLIPLGFSGLELRPFRSGSLSRPETLQV